MRSRRNMSGGLELNNYMPGLLYPITMTVQLPSFANPLVKRFHTYLDSAAREIFDAIKVRDGIFAKVCHPYDHVIALNIQGPTQI